MSGCFFSKKDFRSWENLHISFVHAFWSLPSISDRHNLSSNDCLNIGRFLFCPMRLAFLLFGWPSASLSGWSFLASFFIISLGTLNLKKRNFIENALKTPDYRNTSQHHSLTNLLWFDVAHRFVHLSLFSTWIKYFSIEETWFRAKSKQTEAQSVLIEQPKCLSPATFFWKSQSWVILLSAKASLLPRWITS